MRITGARFFMKTVYRGVLIPITKIRFFIMGSLNSLRWRHNGHDGVSNHQPHHCLLNRLFGCRWTKTSKLRVTGLCAGNSPVNSHTNGHLRGKFFLWWRHHVAVRSDILRSLWSSEILRDLSLGRLLYWNLRFSMPLRVSHTVVCFISMA